MVASDQSPRLATPGHHKSLQGVQIPGKMYWRSVAAGSVGPSRAGSRVPPPVQDGGKARCQA